MVIFRRIGGHIVPIQMNKQEKQRAKGAVQVAAGVGIAAGAGEVSARLSKRAERMGDMAVKAEHRASKAWSQAKGGQQLSFFSKRHAERAHRYMRFTDKLVDRANKLIDVSKSTRRFGIVAGAGLVGAGVERMLRDKTKDNPEARAAISGASGAAAGFIVHETFKNRAARDLTFGKTVQRMAKDAAKKIAHFAVKRRF